ncbi:UDP-glucose 4-epimerase family protein [Shinella sp. BYT-45]|uniref:UDP-glucose 4-epimerase family protein n=1 Tax=Shinella sp. BYT-45 TaxID=3377377 RepID=UPI0039817C7D
MLIVTGASGFIGSHLAEALARTGRPFTLSSRSPGASVRPHRFIPADRLADARMEADCIIHLAGRAHVLRETSLDPAAQFRSANTAYTLSVARAFADRGTRRFIFLSSIGVLGNETAPGRPFTQESPPAPHNDYALSKLEAEEGLRAIAAETGMDVVIIRPPLVYGAGAKGNFASMVGWLRKGVPLPLGSVHNRRSLVGIDNLVDLILTAIDHAAAANRTFLVSDGEDLSTTDLLRRTAAAMGRPARLLPVPTPLLRRTARLLGRATLAQRLLGSLELDIAFTRETLDWQPPISVDEGLARAVHPGATA